MTTQPDTPDDPPPPSVIVCYARCWSCQAGQCYEPPQPHPWWGSEDVEHAEATGQEPPQGNCACPCAIAAVSGSVAARAQDRAS